MAKAEHNGKKGVWRTIQGRKVFIADGQSLNDALKASGKFNKADMGKNTGSDKKTAKDKGKPKDETVDNKKDDKEKPKDFVKQNREKIKEARKSYDEDYANMEKALADGIMPDARAIKAMGDRDKELSKRENVFKAFDDDFINQGLEYSDFESLAKFAEDFNALKEEGLPEVGLKNVKDRWLENAKNFKDYADTQKDTYKQRALDAGIDNDKADEFFKDLKITRDNPQTEKIEDFIHQNRPLWKNDVGAKWQSKIDGDILKHQDMTGNEIVYSNDINGNEVFAPLAGDGNSVNYTNEMVDVYTRAEKHSIIQTHNHPTDSSFSPADMRTFNAFESIKEMRVVTKEGTTYRMIKEGDTFGRLKPREIEDMWNKFRAITDTHYRDKYQSLMNSGADRKELNKARDDLWREQTHAISKRVAQLTGWRYEREEK